MPPDSSPTDPSTTQDPTPPVRHRVHRGSEGYDWLSEKVEHVRAIAAGIRGIRRDVVYEAGAWSILKLVTLLHLNDIYLSIMANQRALGHWDRLYYIDLNSATGLVRIEGTKTVVAGSAIVGADTWRRGPKRAYDHYIFVEPKAEWASALDERLRSILPRDRFTVYAEGADTAVPKIIERLAEANSHYFSVFDPFAFQEGTWESYGKLLQATRRGDMVVTFQTTMVKRATPEIVHKFFGPYATEYRDLSEEGILSLFKNHLQPYRAVVEHVRVAAGGKHGRYYYDLIYAVARTARGNPFMRGIQDLKERIESCTGEQIDRMLGSHSLESYNEGPVP